MPGQRHRRLKKELSLLEVYAIATGATLSAGFFLLPGIAAGYAGSNLVLAYLLAAVPLVPATFSILELATAMPRAGGAYYFLDRSLGPVVGTFGGFGTWLALMLKVAFALIGMGAYLHLFFAEVPMRPLALGITVLLGAFCLRGARMSTGFQVVLVSGLLVILATFMALGVPRINASHFADFLDIEGSRLLATAGLVYVSYVGVTKVASLAEEVRDPERTLPRAVFLSLATALLVYGVGTAVLVGLVPPDVLAGDLTPVASAAERVAGRAGVLVVSVGAILAFVSVANAGILSASRYPVAMSRDDTLPPALGHIAEDGVPRRAVLATVAGIAVLLALFDPTGIAKLASAFQLTIFGLICAAVIVMRESELDSYDPGYRSPLYPWMQIAGIAGAAVLIGKMGAGPLLFAAAIGGLSWLWHVRYASRHSDRGGAIYHVFERLGRRRVAGLDSELRSILKEKGLRAEDPFEAVVARADVLDLPDAGSFPEILEQVVPDLARRVGLPEKELREGFLRGTRLGATPVERGVALPHLRVPGLPAPVLSLVRTRRGVAIPRSELAGEGATTEPVQALFFLVSPEEDPGQHLRLLAQLANRVEEPDFPDAWQRARSGAELRESLLRVGHFLSLAVRRGTPTERWAGRALAELRLPEESLVALVRRQEEAFVPRGSTRLREGDWLTVIGRPRVLQELRRRYATPAEPPTEAS